jgi:DNA-binding Lrp family transcriptional regulator
MSSVLIDVDDTDRVILNMLQDDARVSLREIAEKQGVSEATIFVRIKKLKEKGIIKRFTAVVSPELLGKSLLAFILMNVEPRKLNSVLDSLNQIEDVYEVYDVTGTYYTIAKIRTENRAHLAKIIDTIGLLEGVVSTETAIVLRTVKEETKINL